MAQVKVVITSLDGKVLEQLLVESEHLNEMQLAKVLESRITDEFETSEVD